MEGWFEEEWLLKHNDYSSNVYSSYHDDLLGNSSDKDVYYKHTSMIGTWKYLKESCYHSIECTVATFLAVFMLRRPLNSATLATTTYRKLKKMSDGTGTQVRAQMINKYKVKMAQKEIYNGRDPPWEKGSKERKEDCSNLNCLFIQLWSIYISVISLDQKSVDHKISYLCLIVI